MRNLSADIRAGHSEVDWKGIIGFRNVLVHDYLAVDIERTWDIVKHDLREFGMHQGGANGEQVFHTSVTQ